MSLILPIRVLLLPSIALQTSIPAMKATYQSRLNNNGDVRFSFPEIINVHKSGNEVTVRTQIPYCMQIVLMPPYTVTAQQIARVRSKLGLSKRKLAKILGLSLTTISHYERGERLPSAETLHFIKRLLGGQSHHTIDELL